jgi:hypothetical protein
MDQITDEHRAAAETKGIRLFTFSQVVEAVEHPVG